MSYQRHSYVDFTGTPYISNHGIDISEYQTNTYVPQNINNTFRTIIRSNTSNKKDYNNHPYLTTRPNSSNIFY